MENTEMSIFSRIGNLIISPGIVFKFLTHKPDWTTPIFVLVFVNLCYLVLIGDIVKKDTLSVALKRIEKTINQNPLIPEEQKSNILTQQEELISNLWAFNYVVGWIPMIGTYFLVGLVIKVVCNKLGASSLGYVQCVSIYGYSHIINLLGNLIKIPLIYSNQTIMVNTGLNLFAPSKEVDDLIYIILSQFDIFTLWQIGTLIIGINTITGFKTLKSVIIVLTLWSMVIAGTAGVVVVFNLL